MTAARDLTRARQGRGLSLEDLSRRTRIDVDLLAAIEQGDLDRLPTPFHLKGFIRVVARDLGLDPDLTSERYLVEIADPHRLDIFQPELSPPRPESPVNTEPDDVFVLEHPGQFVVEQAAPIGPRPRAFTSPSHLEKPRAVPVPRRRVPARSKVRLQVWSAIWIIAALLVSAAAGYVAVAAWQRRATSSASTTVAIPAENDNASPGAAASRPASQQDLSGRWRLTNRIERSNVPSFVGLALEFRLELDQEGGRLRGEGSKWMENGRVVAASARTPITVDGTIDDDRVTLAFTERGARRTSRGRLEMRLAEDGSLQGQFSTEAAGSSGPARATRLGPRAD